MYFVVVAEGGVGFLVEGHAIVVDGLDERTNHDGDVWMRWGVFKCICLYKSKPTNFKLCLLYFTMNLTGIVTYSFYLPNLVLLEGKNPNP